MNIEWFKGGTTNIAFNALDRQIAAGRGNQKALIWEGNEPGLDYTLTYQELLEKVCQLANYLRSVGVGKGDFVAIYMPMLAELPIAMLACARIGAVHSVSQTSEFPFFRPFHPLSLFKFIPTFLDFLRLKVLTFWIDFTSFKNVI